MSDGSDVWTPDMTMPSWEIVSREDGARCFVRSDRLTVIEAETDSPDGRSRIYSVREPSGKRRAITMVRADD